MARECHGSLRVVIGFLPISAKLLYHGRTNQSKGLAEGMGKLGGQRQPIVGVRQGLVGVAQEPQRKGCIDAAGDTGVLTGPEHGGTPLGRVIVRYSLLEVPARRKTVPPDRSR